MALPGTAKRTFPRTNDVDEIKDRTALLIGCEAADARAIVATATRASWRLIVEDDWARAVKVLESPRGNGIVAVILGNRCGKAGEFILDLKSRYPRRSIILLTPGGAPFEPLEARRAGASD